MLWISKHRNIGRWAVLVALLAAMLGPWLYTLDGVPPPEWCRSPNVLLENGRCVALVSGATVLTFWVGVFFGLIVQLVSGAFVLPDRARELIGVFFVTVSICLLMLPFLSTLLVIHRGDSRRLRIFHVIAWGAAAIVSVLPILFELTFRSTLFWGIWLYIGLAISMLLMESFALVMNVRRANQL